MNLENWWKLKRLFGSPRVPMIFGFTILPDSTGWPFIWCFCPGQVELFRQRHPALWEFAGGTRLHRRRQWIPLDHTAGGVNSESLAVQFVFQPGVYHLVPVTHDARGAWWSWMCIPFGSHFSSWDTQRQDLPHPFQRSFLHFTTSFSPVFPALTADHPIINQHVTFMFFLFNCHILSPCIVYIYVYHHVLSSYHHTIIIYHLLIHKTRTLIY